MPKGNPSKQTVASEKYQKKAGYKVKSFKLKDDIADRFALACEKAGVTLPSERYSSIPITFRTDRGIVTASGRHHNHNKCRSDASIILNLFSILLPPRMIK